MPQRKGPLRALIRTSGGLGWPILLKELRGDFRRNRFFISHIICLCILAAGILWKVMAQAESTNITPESVGRDIFNTFVLIQILVVVVVFPAFSATALSEERSARTFDLLVTTDLRPEEIIWGKFLASSIYCLIFLIATVPLLSISLLFAGVGLQEILLAYLLLIAMTAFLSMAGVFVSAHSSSNVRATIAMYLISFAILTGGIFQWGGLYDQRQKTTLIQALLLDVLGGPAAGSPAQRVIAALWIFALFAILFNYLFILTANRIRPGAEDKTSRLRILTLLVIPFVLSLRFLNDQRAYPNYDLQVFKDHLALGFLALFMVGLCFTSEPPCPPPRVLARFSRHRGILSFWRIFTPGPFWGLVYSVVLSVATCAGLALVRGIFAGGLDGKAFRYGECLLTVPIYLFAFQALGFFLSTSGFTTAYTALTVAFAAVISSFLPLIFQISSRPDGIFTFYYLSPFTLLDSLSPQESNQVPTYLLFGVPIIRIALVIFGALGILFTALGLRSSRRMGTPPFRR